MTSSSFGNDNSNRIEVLVNENVITKYDIIQRIKMNSILKRVEINENSYNELLNAVIDDLIIEKLKQKEADEYDISFNEDEFKKHEERFYQNIEYKQEDLKKLFDLNDLKFDDLLDVIETDLRWQKLIYGLFLRVTSVTEQEINDLINKNPNISKDIAAEIILQKQLDLKSIKLLKDLRDEATIEYK
tara:strand:- start:17 stop:577 length:561 start_codon:yes stop_codon:yes gene_type:complete